MKFISPSYLLRLYTKQNDVIQILFLSCLFSLSLAVFRVLYTGQLLFLFLVWNLFLAFVPYAWSGWMDRRLKTSGKGLFLSAVFIWLLFIPNSFYLITDLFHLDMNNNIPLWYDLALLLSFAWSGLLMGILSVRQVEKLFEHHFNKRFDLLFIMPVMMLNALGVFIGRYLRFNSWDVITDPFQLVKEIIFLFIHPLRNRFDWSMIICYTILMTLMYLTIKRLSKVL